MFIRFLFLAKEHAIFSCALFFIAENIATAASFLSYQNTAQSAFYDQNGNLTPLYDDFGKDCKGAEGIDARIIEVTDALTIGYSKNAKRKYNLFISASAYRIKTLSSLDLSGLQLSFEDEQKAKIEINNLGCYFDNEREIYAPGTLSAGFGIYRSILGLPIELSLSVGKSFAKSSRSIRYSQNDLYLATNLTPILFSQSKVQLALPLGYRVSSGFYELSYGASLQSDIDLFTAEIGIIRRNAFFGNFKTASDSFEASTAYYFDSSSSIGISYSQTISGSFSPYEQSFSASINKFN